MQATSRHRPQIMAWTKHVSIKGALSGAS